MKKMNEKKMKQSENKKVNAPWSCLILFRPLLFGYIQPAFYSNNQTKQTIIEILMKKMYTYFLFLLPLNIYL